MHKTAICYFNLREHDLQIYLILYDARTYRVDRLTTQTASKRPRCVNLAKHRDGSEADIKQNK